MNKHINRPRPFDTLSLAAAYLLGGLFLYGVDVPVGDKELSIMKLLGIIFIALAFSLAIFSLFKRTASWVQSIDKTLFLALFSVTLSRVAVAAAKNSSTVWIGIAFLFLVFIVFLIHIYLETKNQVDKKGGRVVAVKVLSYLSFVIAVFALIQLFLSNEFYGGPILHLALSIVLLSASIILSQRTIDIPASPDEITLNTSVEKDI
jgi:hypothetical protein